VKKGEVTREFRERAVAGASAAALAARSPDMDALVGAVQRALSPDMLKEPWRSKVVAGKCDPMTGYCSTATEALYYLLGGKAAGWKAVVAKHEGGSHWWLEGPNGEIVDATASQFKTPVPYKKGRGIGFQTYPLPSKNAALVIDRVLETRIPVAQG
jgi:hypothetical protein